jgi:CheY-like chemotaxis protein
VGSTFFAEIPVHYVEPAPSSVRPLPVPGSVGHDSPVLVVEDSPEEMLVYEKFLKGSGFYVVPAATVRQARQALAQVKPAAILLDILLRGEDAWKFLAEVKTGATTRNIPVIVATSVDDARKGLALGADVYANKPLQRGWLLTQLRRVTGRQPIRRVLVIDDDEVSRYLVRRLLDDLPCVVSEAVDGTEGLRRALKEAPDAIFLDLAMPDISGEEVLERLRAEPVTAGIPVVVVTSKVLDADERERLERHALTVVSKATERAVAAAKIRAALGVAGVFSE